MNDRTLVSDPSKQVANLAVAWSRKIILLAVVVVVVSTLYPFKFSLNTGTPPLEAIIQNFNGRSSYLDIAANIVLFAPLGFGIGSAFAKYRASFLTKLLGTIALSGGFSLVIELLQVFLPGREPTPLDVASNALGGAVGFLGFYWVGTFFYAAAAIITDRARSLLSKVSLKYLLAVLGIYVVLASWLVISWQGSSLKGWYDGFPLAVGNNYSFYHQRLHQQVSGAWKGSVADLVLFDRAFSRPQVETFFAKAQSFPPEDSSVVAAYSLRGQQGHEDLIGQSPDLIWQGKPAEMSDLTGASVTANHWLKTSEPLKFVSTRIRNTSQFTVSALITAGDISSLAPYFQQIISIANPNGFGNFNLSQVQSSLSLTLTLLRINRSADLYHQLVPNVFLDEKPHRLVVTYSGFVLRVYVDGVERSALLDLTPNRFQIMLYLLVLVPLALLIALVANRVQRIVWLYLITVGAGTVLPALLLEGFLANEGDRNVRLSNLLLGMVIVGGTILALKSNFKQPRQILASGRSS